MSGFPIPDGATWDGETGREWEAHGDLERFEYAADDLTFRVYYAPATAAAGVWGSWVESSDRLQALNFTRQVADWYLGVRPSMGSVLVENTEDPADDGFPVAGKIRLTVEVPSGEQTLFEGVITDTTHVLRAERYPTMRVAFTDFLGYNSQDDVAEITTTGVTDAMLWALLTLIDGAAKSATHWDTGGATQQSTLAIYNPLDRLSQYVRGELGMLWTTRDGSLGFRKSGWWNNNRTTAVAAIGSDLATAPNPYTYGLPHSGMAYVASARRILNDITWATPHTTPTSHNRSDGTSKVTYSKKKRDDDVLLTVSATVVTQLQAFIDRTKDPVYNANQVRIPADLSADAMEFAAGVEVCDFVNVEAESQVGYWTEWVDAHVLSVTHQWSPGNGWWLTLDTTSELFEEGD